MGRFPDRLDLTPHDDGIHWTVLSEFRYQDDKLGFIVVPVDFPTDGGSIPGLFQNIISPMGKGLRAFLIHDWLYAIQTTTKEEADSCLLRALEDIGFNHIGGDVIYAAVRDGGKPSWDEDSKNIEVNRKLGGIHG